MRQWRRHPPRKLGARPTTCCSRLPLTPKPTRGIGSLDFAAAARAAYNFSEICAAALEHYANYGRLSQLEPISRQFQTLFAVVDYKGEPLSAEFGTAMASRRAPDALIVRLIL